MELAKEGYILSSSKINPITHLSLRRVYVFLILPPKTTRRGVKFDLWRGFVYFPDNKMLTLMFSISNPLKAFTPMDLD